MLHEVVDFRKLQSIATCKLNLYFDVNLLYSFCVISSFLYQFNCFLRANLKYYSYNEFKLGHNAAEAYRNIRLTFEKDSIDERIIQ